MKDRDYGICEGRYTVGWLDENAGGIEKKLSELQRRGKSWLRMERGVRATPLVPVCVIWQYQSGQILLFLAQLQVPHGHGLFCK